MSWLMLGPSASASPQAHSAHEGSRREASRNARTASPKLNPQTSAMPWSKNACAVASALAVASR